MKQPPQWWCTGACDQGRKCCPAPDACERPENSQTFAGRMVSELAPVAVIFVVVLIAFLITKYFS